MLPLALKSLLGTLVVLAIALLSRSRSFFIAGLIPLFPAFALIAHAVVGAERGMADLRTTALFGLCFLPPYGVYLGAVYWLSPRWGLTATLAGATAAWFLSATAVLGLVWGRFSLPAN